jgi:alkylhydroperoxidase/carboxymuconolactone decarboxylase family protein YurZ
MTEVSKDTADALESLAVAEEGIISSLLEMQLHNLENSGLDPRTYSLVKIAALIAVDAPQASYVGQVAFALEASVEPEEMMKVLIAVAPQVGLPRALAAAPKLMLALGGDTSGVGETGE